jgi:hypothetical protein
MTAIEVVFVTLAVAVGQPEVRRRRMPHAKRIGPAEA